MSKFIFESKFVRRLPDPVLGANVQRHIFMMSVERLPPGLPRDPNPRAANINRVVWREIREHLLNERGAQNTFHLKNKGITILASAVERIDDEHHTIVFGKGDGIVDGGHTYELITDAVSEITKRNVDDDEIVQYVKVEVLTGLPVDLVTEIAGGLNTAIQVQAYSLENLKGSFDWIRQALAGKPYADKIAYRENEDAPFDVRDILVLCDLFNIKEFPNDSSECPRRAYMSKASVLDNYVEHPQNYRPLSNILPDILDLHDRVSSQARDMHNEAGGKGGKLAFVESRKTAPYEFCFLGGVGKYRLHQSALLPMLGAFRWMVRLDEKTGQAAWDGGYPAVLEVWNAAAADLMRATQSTSDDNNRKVHAIGRSHNHWQTMHNIVAKRQLMMARGR
jgi:hypothetical protein